MGLEKPMAAVWHTSAPLQGSSIVLGWGLGIFLKCFQDIFDIWPDIYGMKCKVLPISTVNNGGSSNSHDSWSQTCQELVLRNSQFPQQPLKVSVIIHILYRCKNWGSGWLINLPQVTRFVSGEAGILSLTQKPVLFLLFLLTFTSEQSRPQAD